MQLHQLSGVKKKRGKRIGRGGKRGTYSGRGIKGQKARTGRRIRPAIRELILRIPKWRGFNNKPIKPKPIAIALRDISYLKEEVTVAVLKREGFLPASFRGEVKIVGKNKLSHPLILKGLLVTSGARESILKSGGKVE